MYLIGDTTWDKRSLSFWTYISTRLRL